MTNSGRFVNPRAPIPPNRRDAFQSRVRESLERLDREAERPARPCEHG